MIITKEFRTWNSTHLSETPMSVPVPTHALLLVVLSCSPTSLAQSSNNLTLSPSLHSTDPDPAAVFPWSMPSSFHRGSDLSSCEPWTCCPILWCRPLVVSPSRNPCLHYCVAGYRLDHTAAPPLTFTPRPLRTIFCLPQVAPVASPSHAPNHLSKGLHGRRGAGAHTILGTKCCPVNHQDGGYLGTLWKRLQLFAHKLDFCNILSNY